MNRSLALLPCVLLASLSLTGAADAKSTSLAKPLAIGGVTAYTQPKANRLKLSDLRTGEDRVVDFPGSAPIRRSDVTVGNRVIAAVSTREGEPLKLTVTGLGIRPRILESIDRVGVVCGNRTQIKPLRVDSRGGAHALIIPSRYDSSGRLCVPDATATRLMEYSPDGTSIEVNISDSMRNRAASSHSTVVMRADKLLIASHGPAVSEVVVHSLHSGMTFFSGNLPGANEWALPDDGVIWSYRESVKPHASRVNLFNYRTGKQRSLEFPHPRGALACGKFTVFGASKGLDIFDDDGKRVQKSGLPRSLFYSGSNVCSSRFLYLTRRTFTLSEKRFERARGELIDLARFR